MRHRAGTATRRWCAGQWCTERTASLQALTRGARTFVVFMVVAGAHAGCGTRDDDARARRASAAASQGAGTDAAPPAASSGGTLGVKPLCPATGTWQLCNVMERLERAGLAPRREPGDAREPPLSQTGIAITLGRAELRVFIYSDRPARERDQARLERAKYVAATEPLSMQAEPTLIVSENLLAILRSRSDHQRERVSDALTAGPPQPPGTKG
jgi:hypothetical protein